MWTRRIAVSLMFLFACMFAASSASAQSGFGIRAGASDDPDQFYFGAHADVKEIVEQFWFRPNAELGLGRGLTLFSLNGEFVYDVPIKSRQWVAYVGGGPAFLIGSFRTPFGRETETGGGFNFVGGMRQRKGFMGELKLGAFDSPDVKLGIGWTW